MWHTFRPRTLVVLPEYRCWSPGTATAEVLAQDQHYQNKFLSWLVLRVKEALDAYPESFSFATGASQKSTIFYRSSLALLLEDGLGRRRWGCLSFDLVHPVTRQPVSRPIAWSSNMALRRTIWDCKCTVPHATMVGCDSDGISIARRLSAYPSRYADALVKDILHALSRQPGSPEDAFWACERCRLGSKTT